MILTSERERLAYRAGVLRGYEMAVAAMRDATSRYNAEQAAGKAMEFAFSTREDAHLWNEDRALDEQARALEYAMRLER